MPQAWKPCKIAWVAVVWTFGVTPPPIEGVWAPALIDPHVQPSSRPTPVHNFDQPIANWLERWWSFAQSRIKWVQLSRVAHATQVVVPRGGLHPTGAVGADPRRVLHPSALGAGIT